MLCIELCLGLLLEVFCFEAFLSNHIITENCVHIFQKLKVKGQIGTMSCTCSQCHYICPYLKRRSFSCKWILLLYICREILKEIQRLRKEQEANARLSNGGTGTRNPTLLAELRLLRQRRDELEARMSALQESRRELMVQLEGLMKLLKVISQFQIKSPLIESVSSPHEIFSLSFPTFIWLASLFECKAGESCIVC